MRPTRLELEGFTAFRARTVVDFSGAELFALTGPTGSGKSSLVDAMVFALYGCVPRLDRRAVAPIISLGAAEAKLRLDFTVGPDAFTAVRVVRRTRTGATTKEARLERADGEVLAGNADEVSAAVADLLGLTYDHFVKCVVLPQGEFAAFLHDSGADRQGLLVKLLDLGLYERMAGVARQRQADGARRVDQLDGQLTALVDATPEAVVVAADRLESLEKLAAQAEVWAEHLADLEATVASVAEAEAEAVGQQRLLAGLVMPEGVVDRSAKLAELRVAAIEADDARATAVQLADAAEAALLAGPKRSELETALQAHVDLAGHRAQQAKGQRVLAEAVSAVADADAALVHAERAAADATEALEGAQWQHRAHDLTARLEVGQPCPVCAQVVAELPASGTAVGLVAAAREAKRLAEADAERAGKAQAAAQRHRTIVEAKLGSVDEQVHQLAVRTERWADPTVVETTLAEVMAAEAGARAAAEAARSAASDAVRSARAVADLEAAQTHDLAAFDAARDAVAALGPPPVDRADLGEAWTVLTTWSAEQRPMLAATIETAEGQLATCRADAVATRREATDALAAAGLHLADAADPSRLVADAVGGARATFERLERDAARAADLGSAVAAARRDADLAHALGQHLSARGFEKWVLDEALAQLTVGATEILRTLSADAYSLSLDEKANFIVIDHRNADDERSARTLSGGETFLASLALALALADQVGSLAAEGAARIESIFLDEGFGSLDPDSLDTVAAAIEELGSRGRMVGLISHVAELAERVPVRFVVHREPGGSTVEKVVS